MIVRHASCSCGQLSVEVDGEPIRVSVCHCLACQRRSGSVFATQARFPRDRAKITGQATEFERIGDEGSKATFRFCPTCGATVYYTNTGMEDQIAIPVGAFADPQFPAPWVSVYEDRKHGWVVMPVDMQHFA